MTGNIPFTLSDNEKNCSFALTMLVPYLNAIYSVFSYGIKRYTGILFNPPLPPSVSIELSSRCNLSCPECVTGAGLLKRRTDFIDYLVVEKISAQLKERVRSTWLYGQGEPMLHPRFFDIVKLFHKMDTVVSTNGHFLDDENCRQLVGSGLKKVIISYDGITPESYNIYRRGGNHSEVTEGIKRLTDINNRNGSPLKIELQFLIHRYNEHEAEKAALFAQSAGVGFRIKSMQVLDTARAGEWMPSDKRKARYFYDDGRWKAADTPSRGCIRMWTAPVITVDGDVIPCCFDKFARHVMGNIESQTFSDIWKSRQYACFRSDVIKSRIGIDICSDCPQGRKLIFRN
jgi:radical SAM protein with 4Fe4S-binding SPASM domain